MENLRDLKYNRHGFYYTKNTDIIKTAKKGGFNLYKIHHICYDIYVQNWILHIRKIKKIYG
ncbi:MAG: hypothetical protein COU51_04960 [Parcubacteria group bacterium CG10_big_fil_rev_8_21_14_0_10_36_14]|nr:MAG: hypothetical protein COU51_04960 [Parcubacteria group bacterium CG10_big_fil_rev_8_21_14_0_10_36_14]